jgi:acetylornithine deacetylase
MTGRGAADMKAGLAANLFAFDALRRAGCDPAGRIHFQSVVEEECTGNGTLACLAQGYHADAVLIPEPEDEHLVRANAGVLWFQVKVRGQPAHTRVMAAGANAIDAAFRIVGALRELEARRNAEHARHRHFEQLAHPLNLNIGRIQGGDWASTVPPWCVFDARWAFYPGVSAAEVRAEVTGCVQEAAARDPFLREHPPEIVFNGFSAEGYVLPEGTAAERTLAEAHRQVFDAELQSFTTPAYLDARVYMIYDRTPALVYGPNSERIHGFDERVELESVRRITKTMALFVADWCGTSRR